MIVSIARLRLGHQEAMPRREPVEVEREQQPSDAR